MVWLFPFRPSLPGADLVPMTTVVAKADEDRLLLLLSDVLHDNPMASTTVKDCAHNLGRNPDHVLSVAKLLQSRGWVKYQGFEGFLFLTAQGIDQARSLRNPPATSWFKEHSLLFVLVSASITTTVAAVGTLLYLHVVPAIWHWLFGQ